MKAIERDVDTSTAFHIHTVDVGVHSIRVGIRPGNPDKTPLLLFNGIGANLEIMEPFAEAMGDVGVIIFDVPGVGGSPATMFPYRMSMVTVIADRLLTQLGYEGQVDVLGVSWGGALAQEFAHLYANRCRKLVLCATSPGVIMMPGSLSVLSKMMGSRRYTDPDYMSEIGGEIYGGDFRKDANLLKAHAGHVKRPAIQGYLYQLLAIMSWSSLPWLRALKAPTLILHGNDDPIVPLFNAEMMASQIPDCTLTVLDDGHLFLISRAKEVAATVLDFLHADQPTYTEST